MSKRRGWQIAAVSGLWLGYGGFVLWPLVYVHVGDRLFTVPLALALGLLGWAMVALRRFIAARQSRFRHWETRLPIESLFALLLALMEFVADMLAVFATQRSLADAPFAQIGWFILIFALLAIVLICVGGLTYLALQTPVPTPGGYRDERSNEGVTAPPGSTAVTSPEANKLLFDVSHHDGVRQLWIIGIFFLAIGVFLSTLPVEIAYFIIAVGFSWGVWHLIAIFPSRASKKLTHYPLHMTIAVNLFIVDVVLFFFVFNDKSILTPFVLINTVLKSSALLRVMMGIDNYYRAIATGRPQEAKQIYQLHYFPLLYLYISPKSLSVSSWPLIFGIIFWLFECILLAFVLRLHIASSIRAVRAPAQSEVVA